MTDKEIIVTIIIALISNGGLTALVVGIFDVVKKKMDKTSGNAKRLADIEKKLDEHIAQSYRNKILDMQNSCLRGERHSYEEFGECLTAIECYENHCKENNVNNEKCKMAIEYIKGIYRQCQTQSDFAPMSAQMINEDELRRMINNVNQIG